MSGANDNNTLRISVATEDDRLAQLQLAKDTKIETVKMLVEAELSIPVASQTLLHNNVPLNDNMTLGEARIVDDDILIVRRGNVVQQRPQQQESLESIPPQLYANPAGLQEYIRSRPALLQQLLHVNPTMAEAVLAPDAFLLTQLLNQMAAERQRRDQEEKARIMELEMDPLDPRAQEKISEIIRQRNVQENMEKAMEYHPESFARVHMLYIPCVVNNVSLKAFVDSGAQSTIMSEACAQRCGIMRLVDRRFHGVAKGVGSAKILGRVHAAPIRIGNSHFQCSFTILENQDMDFLLGLDQLKHHQACIDLKKNVLRIGNEEIEFLPEKDIPHSDEDKAPSSPPSSSSSSSSSTAPAPAPASRPVQPVAPHSQPLQPQPQRTAPAPAPAPGRAPAPAPARAGPAPGGPAPGQGQAQAPRSFPEEEIVKLTNLGFSRQMAIQALTVCNGNTEMAASLLFQQQMQF